MSETELVPSGGGVELAGLFDPRVEGALTQEERSLITALVSRDERIDITIPETIDDESLWDALQVCCKVESRVRKVQGVLKMLVGRALILMQSRPNLYKKRGYATLDGLMSDEDSGLPAMTGISRSELYNAKRIAESFPTIPMQDYRDVGFNKLLVIAKIRKEGDSDTSQWLERAKNSTIESLKEQIYRSDNGIPEGSLDLDTLTITLSKSEKVIIQDFLKNPDWQAYCGTALPAPMLMRAIEEASTEWAVQVRDQESR